MPKTLSTDEKMIVSYLEKQIRKFPENSFGPLITIDKKMLYGRYLKFIEIATKKDYNHSAIVQFNIEDFPIKAS